MSKKAQKDNLGIESQLSNKRSRTINQDGSFNIIRKNSFFNEFKLFSWIQNINWTHYWLSVFVFYVVLNLFFGWLYYLIGPENLSGVNGTCAEKYWQCFFFSVQTFTTVGYGNLSPTGILTNTVASVEAFLGIMTIALCTGTLYGRFSKPKSHLIFSSKAIVAPFRDNKALMFMVANGKKGNLVEASAKINFSWVEKNEQGNSIRKFETLTVDIEKINMLVLSWTIVSYIEKGSMLDQMTEKDFIEKECELYILISAYDDTFAQTVHARSSYLGEEIVYGAKFKRPFYINDDGITVLDIKAIGEYELVSI